ncbi:MAG TPA: succinate dehydrogenase assembly factor 2 [Thiotrichales bacterium]|nr:succinate dehydrogenase assembly factor 2 [Thiotrichales bacterium]
MSLPDGADQTKQPAELSLPELRWQCRRGMLELDILLNTFLDRQYAQLDEKQRETFVSLLAYPDQTLYELLMATMTSASPDIADLVSRLRSAAMQ